MKPNNEQLKAAEEAIASALGKEPGEWDSDLTHGVASLLADREAKAYQDGHIDHQLIVEAATQEIASAVLKRSTDRAGKTISFNAKEILEKARKEGGKSVYDGVFMAHNCTKAGCSYHPHDDGCREMIAASQALNDLK